MGDNWCKSHVLKKDNPNFHFSKYLISKIILKSFSSMIRARAETCQKCKLFLFCVNTRLIYKKNILKMLEIYEFLLEEMTYEIFKLKQLSFQCMESKNNFSSLHRAYVLLI